MPGNRLRSDLGVRTLSALVMLVIAGAALWAGGFVFILFILLVAAAVLIEWFWLVRAFSKGRLGQILWLLGGLAYVGSAAWLMISLRQIGLTTLLVSFIGIVIATDVGAYFSGRTIGGPKIAPSISPSKTWAGLVGGMVLAALFAGVSVAWGGVDTTRVMIVALCGAMLAIVAQAGDFFESWMKRRAGVKDSGVLIPGHGGVFDRVDGLLPVVIIGSAAVALISAGAL